MTDNFNNELYTEYLNYLYQRIDRKYPDCKEADTLVQETLLALFIANGKMTIENPYPYINSILKNKYNDLLRKKYRNLIISYDIPETIFEEESDDESEVYESVRREIGRLIRIYREVTILYYVQNMSVEDIAKKLEIPKGTVLSRLSKARKQVKEGIKKMEKYSEASYDPKHLTMGIWGGTSLNGAPFSLVSGLIEENILILAYQKPISIKNIADTMGIPCPYIEPIVNSLVEGELMGRTSGDLVYTRCFIQSYNESLGDLNAQEELADKYAEQVWEGFSKDFLPLMNREPYVSMTDKQKAEFLLFLLNKVINMLIQSLTKDQNNPINPPERKNGGRWIAYCTVFKEYEEPIAKYSRSGPLHMQYCDSNGKCKCKMLDFQSVFGDTHYAYRNFKYNCRPQSIMRFFASFINKDIQTDDFHLYELCEDFQRLKIVRIAENGKHVLDIPVVSFDEWRLLENLCKKCVNSFNSEYKEDILKLWNSHINKVPNHIDLHDIYTHTGALHAYPIAQMLSIVNKELFPIEIEIGKTPLILLICNKGEE